MNKNLLTAGVAVASLAVGAAAGYFVAEKMLVKKFDEILEAELANTKKFYERKNKVGDFETPEAAAAKLGVSDGPAEEAADAVVNYASMHIKGDAAVITSSGIVVTENLGEVLSNAAEQMEEATETVRNIFGKEPGEPVQITFDEFAQIGENYDSESVTYYMGDKVVADHSDQHLEDDNRCIGLDNLYKFHEDETLTELYVQNDRLKTVYEITRSTGKYSEEVLGFEHSDATFEPRQRRQRLRDE